MPARLEIYLDISQFALPINWARLGLSWDSRPRLGQSELRGHFRFLPNAKGLPRI